MCYLIKIWSREKGFSLIELFIAIAITSIAIIGAYGLVIATENYYKTSTKTSIMYDQSRIALERMYRDMSETSNQTIAIGSYAISFASPRDENGDFVYEDYTKILSTKRPSWQKAIVYYLYGSGDERKLYRKEIPKTDWSSNYDPGQAIDGNGEIIAENAVSMSFSYYPAETLQQAHTIQVNLELTTSRNEIETGALPTVKLNTRIPFMNRRK